MKKFIVMLTVLAIWLTLGTFTASADVLQKKIVPADTSWLIHIDMEMFNSTYLKELLLDNEKDPLHLKKARESVLKEAQMDIFKDVTAITIMGKKGAEGKTQEKKVENKGKSHKHGRKGNENLALYCKGAFNPPHIISLLKKNEKYQTSGYGGYTIHELGGEAGFTFIGDGALVFSPNGAILKHVLDTIDGKKPSIAGGKLDSLLGMIPSDAFVSAVADNISSLRDFQGQAVMLQKAGMASFMALEDSRNLLMKVMLSTQSEDTAIQVEQIIKGLIALVNVSGDEHKEKFADVLQALSMERKGSTIRLSLSYPSDKVVDIITH